MFWALFFAIIPSPTGEAISVGACAPPGKGPGTPSEFSYIDNNSASSIT
jgi:hypothetical protein